ncbi:MAG: response regulator [Candidatus Binatia bacterium]
MTKRIDDASIRDSAATGRDGTTAVLLVEDDRDTQAYMTTVLASRYQVLLAASAEEARRLLALYDGRVGIVLMDLSLRGTEDGLSLTRWLRSDERWRMLPIIVTTAHAYPEDRARSLAAGCDAYLAKPFPKDELLSLMEELLARGPAGRGHTLH